MFVPISLNINGYFIYRKAVNEQKEMKLLLDMYKGVSKEQRDKVQLMAAEKKLRTELEELRQQLKKIQESKREDRKKLADDEALRKIKMLEEQKYELQKQVCTALYDGWFCMMFSIRCDRLWDLTRKRRF